RRPLPGLADLPPPSTGPLRGRPPLPLGAVRPFAGTVGLPAGSLRGPLRRRELGLSLRAGVLGRLLSLALVLAREAEGLGQVRRRDALAVEPARPGQVRGRPLDRPAQERVR